MAAGESKKVQIDPSDPLFLHPSDQPGQSLVAELFNGEDFENWRRSVRIALSAKQKIAFIDGSYPRPAAGSSLLGHWQRCNDMVISWLLNSLHKSIRDSVIFCENACDIWKELEERYGQSNKARLFQAQKEVSCISQGDLDVASYFNKARRVWDEFHAVGARPRCECNKCECTVSINLKLQNYDEEQKLIQFLMGLNETYTAIRGSILMMTPLPSLSQAYSLLIQEERQRQVKSGGHFGGDAASFIVQHNSENITKPFTQFSQPKKQDRKRPILFCDFCERRGHTVDKCYKLHGFPGDSRGSKGYRGANSNHAWGEQNSQNDAVLPQQQLTEQPACQLPGLNQEQSKQLLQFLAKLTAESQSVDSSSSAAHMAGPFSEEATGNW